jgi:hypothetical protein
VRSAIRPGTGEAAIDELMPVVKRFGRRRSDRAGVRTTIGRQYRPIAFPLAFRQVYFLL